MRSDSIEVMLDDVIGRMSGNTRGRDREKATMIPGDQVQNYVVDWKELLASFVTVRVKLGIYSWAFVSTYGPGSNKHEVDVLLYREETCEECAHQLRQKAASVQDQD